jgi:hypothetical protein
LDALNRSEVVEFAWWFLALGAISRMKALSFPAGAPHAIGDTPISLDLPPPYRESRGGVREDQTHHSCIDSLLHDPGGHPKMIRMFDGHHPNSV